MRRAIVAFAAVIVLVVLGSIAGRAFGLGPLASAPRERLYVAISRSDDVTAAHEIEVVDLREGERLVFDAGVRIAALALAPDRRTLYAGGPDGDVAVIDAASGARLRTLDVRPSIVQLFALPGDRLIVATSVPGPMVALWDASRARELARRELAGAGTIGRGAVVGDEVLVPIAEPNAITVVRLDAATLAVRGTDAGLAAGALGAPALVARPDAKVAVLSSYDTRLASARLTPDVGQRALDIALAAVPSAAAIGVRQVRSDLAVASDGSLHACVSDRVAAARYRVPAPYVRAEPVGTECGWFARSGDTLFVALRGRSQLLQLDAAGSVVRTLPLPGLTVAIAY